MLAFLRDNDVTATRATQHALRLCRSVFPNDGHVIAKQHALYVSASHATTIPKPRSIRHVPRGQLDPPYRIVPQRQEQQISHANAGLQGCTSGFGSAAG